MKSNRRNSELQSLKRFLPEIRKNVSLKNYTTFKIGGPAKYFFEAKTEENIISAINLAKKFNLPFFILGQGSKLLVSDKGFKGLVIKAENKKQKIENKFLEAEAGVLVSTLVEKTINLGLSGLEWAGGMPGTLGGATRGNAGSFGKEIGDSLLWVKALDRGGKFKKFSKKQCQFSYRSSVFKKKRLIVLAALLKLKRANPKILKKIVKEHIKYRKEKMPLEYPSAGSIFKNCDVKKIPLKWRKKFSDVIKKDPFPVLPVAHLISEAGLKGFKVGNAQISQKHPNFIVNLGAARAKDIKKLIELVKKKLKNKFGIELKEEIVYVGFKK